MQVVAIKKSHKEPMSGNLNFREIKRRVPASVINDFAFQPLIQYIEQVGHCNPSVFFSAYSDLKWRFCFFSSCSRMLDK